MHNGPPDEYKRKQSLYFPTESLQEIQREANRLDRSMSWVVQQMWRISRDKIREMPSADTYLPKGKP